MAKIKYEIELYRLDIVNLKFVRKAKITTFQNLRYTNVLCGIGECTFELNALDPKLTKSNFRERVTQIVIKRNGQIVWFGPYFNYEAQVSETGGKVTIRAYSYMFHLTTRYTEKLRYYPPNLKDQAVIARELIDFVQEKPNGALLILTGNETTGVKRERTYQWKQISDALENFSRVAKGFEFDFEPITSSAGKLTSVKFSIYYPQKGRLRNDLPPVKLGAGRNVQAFGSATNGELYNAGYSEGAGEGNDIPIAIYDTDNLDQEIATKADALQKAFTRIEVYQPDKEEESQVELMSTLRGFMDEKATPATKFNFQLNPKRKPLYGEFGLGDTLVVDVDIRDIVATAGDLLVYKGSARIYEIAVTYSTNGKETLIPKVIYVE